MSGLKSLFSPITINGLELANRAVMPAMGTAYGGLDGSVTERLVEYLARRARGGTALIITEVCAVDPRGRGFPAEIGSWSDDQIDGLSKIAEAIHREGGAAALQMHHAGRETFASFTGGAPPEAPSAIASAVLKQPCEEMSTERIAEVVEAYANSADRAVKAGFDAVELHGAHGYLINQFLSPFSNQRSDEYGGSNENRARFAVEVLMAVRRSVGRGFPIIIRLSADELVRGGYNISFMEWLAPLLVEAGADCIHASAGVSSTPGSFTIAPADIEPGFNLPRSRAIKQVVDVPVIGVGRINDPRLADEAISRGDADLISFGRQHLADPDLINKARVGEFQDIRWCLACNQGCIERLAFELKSITCSINPECGDEYKETQTESHTPKRVWVIGAGPAGLSAALRASALGHRVELFDRSQAAGGQLIPASCPPNKMAYADWVEWAVRTLKPTGVKMHLGQEVTGGSLREGKPDYLILATGALPCVPEIPGIDSDRICDATAVLNGEVALEDEALILGAGHVGMETADFLIERGIKVSLLEMSPTPPVGKISAHGYWLHRRLKDAGTAIILGAEVVRIEPETVVFLQNGEESSIEHKGLVVTALGSRSETRLVSVLEELGLSYTVVGDAKAPRRLLEAVHEGYSAASSI